ncbi:MAG: GntR family transcriptional regulator [Candidatus Dormibacteria bacterium]
MREQHRLRFHGPAGHAEQRTDGSDAGRAYKEIRRRILELELAPGAEVTEGALAADIGVSKTPVREALLLLSGDGMVFARHGAGYRVAPITLTSAHEAFALRALLEGEAAAIVAARPDLVGRLSELDEISERWSDAALRGHASDRLGANLQFHAWLGFLGENQRLAMAVVSSVLETSRIVRLATRLSPGIDFGGPSHSEIVASLRADPAKARAGATDHVLSTERAVTAALLRSSALQSSNLAAPAQVR